VSASLSSAIFLTSLSWRDKWHVSWFNDFIGRLSSETKPRPKSWPTLSSVWRRLNNNDNKDQSNLAKCGIAVHPIPHLYLPGGSVGLTVWLQFAVACFGWRLQPADLPFPWKRNRVEKPKLVQTFSGVRVTSELFTAPEVGWRLDNISVLGQRGW